MAANSLHLLSKALVRRRHQVGGSQRIRLYQLKCRAVRYCWTLDPNPQREPGGGGHVKFYPYEKGGGKSLSHAEGGGGGGVYTVACSFSHIEGGGTKSSHFKSVGAKGFTLS